MNRGIKWGGAQLKGLKKRQCGVLSEEPPALMENGEVGRKPSSKRRKGIGRRLEEESIWEREDIRLSAGRRR